MIRACTWIPGACSMGNRISRPAAGALSRRSRLMLSDVCLSTQLFIPKRTLGTLKLWSAFFAALTFFSFERLTH